MIKKGTKVTTHFHPGEEKLVRTILSTSNYDGILLASASGGEPCPSCSKPEGTQVPMIKTSYFKEVK